MYQTKNNTLLHLAPILFGIMIAMSGCEQPEISSQTLLKTSALSTAAPKTNNSSKTLAQNAIKQSTHTKLSEKAEAFAKTQLNLEESALLEKFFSHLAPRKSKIRFGSLVAQAGLLQLGLPYDTTPEPSGPETLNLRLNKFQCVSLVETSVALARCTVKEQPNEACFLKEMEENRYRGGENKGYSSRLHYFVDWLADNATRGRIQILSEKLGGETTQKTFSFMSTHPDLYPQLSDPEILRKIKIKEEELSKKGISVIRKVDSAAIEKELQDGDILAIVSSKPGILVAHTALVKVNQNGERRVLHASHHHNRVLLTRATVSEYLKARPERIGVLIARPLPPEKQESTIGL